MTAADIDAIERAAQEALPREDLCGLCGCEDEPYFPKKWEGCNAVNCVRASRLKVQIAYIAAANPAAILSLIARLREAERQRDEARAALVWRPTHRHRKRGSVYQRERDNVEIQTSRPIVEGDIISVYVGKDGKPWGRLNEEFEDGRFEALSALPPPAGSETGEG